MSTFGGFIEEIPGISIDRFDGDNFKSFVYFLSHCHTDHMVGLWNDNFRDELLIRENVYLYGSPVTVQILKCKFPDLKPKCKALPVNVPTLIAIPPDFKKTFNVTPLTAGHCPGSVMFLFETDKSILYTGDFRVSTSDLKKYKAFYQEGGQGPVKKIHKMHVDTTFFNTSHLQFPPRQQSLDTMIRIIKEWFCLGLENVINIKTSATYGSEYLFIELSKEFNMPVHVNQTVYDFYKHIPDMDEAVTLNPACTRLHSSCGLTYKTICTSLDIPVRTIKPSAWYWTNLELENCIEDHDNQYYRVCYSSHCSFKEIVEFIMFLKPESVEPNVLPRNSTEREIMLNALRSVVESYKEKESETHNSADNNFKLFKIGQGENGKTDSEVEEYDSNLDDLLDSPPRKMRKEGAD